MDTWPSWLVVYPTASCISWILDVASISTRTTKNIHLNIVLVDTNKNK